MDLASLGRFDEALARYQRAIEVDPGYAKPIPLIGNHYWFVLGQLDEAVVWYAKGISLDPGNPRGSADLGWLVSWTSVIPVRPSTGLSDPSSWVRKLIPQWMPCSFFICTWVMKPPPWNMHANLMQTSLGSPYAWLFLKNDALRAGRYSEARGLYEKSFPELVNESDPKIRQLCEICGRYRSSARLVQKLASRNEQIYCWIAASSTSKPFRGSDCTSSKGFGLETGFAKRRFWFQPRPLFRLDTPSFFFSLYAA